MQREKIDILININDETAIIYKDEAPATNPYTGHYYYEIDGKRSKRNFYTWEDITTYLYKRGFIFY